MRSEITLNKTNEIYLADIMHYDITDVATLVIIRI